jgi:hypothetical protein
VTVNAIAPALIEDTGMLPGDPGALATMIPVGRLGRPEEVADLALAVLRNGYMTNQVVSLDGGMHPRWSSAGRLWRCSRLQHHRGKGACCGSRRAPSSSGVCALVHESRVFRNTCGWAQRGRALFPDTMAVSEPTPRGRPRNVL